MKKQAKNKRWRSGSKMDIQSVTLFSNGNYLVFDKNGEQLVELQKDPKALAKALKGNKDLERNIGDWENGIVKTTHNKLFYIFARLEPWDKFEEEPPVKV